MSLGDRIKQRLRLRALIAAYVENDLLTYASAISFQVLSAFVPFLLFAIALLGFLSFDEVWSGDLAPEIEPNVSSAAFALIDDTVKTVLSTRQLFWLTAGLLLAIWQISGAVRAVMGAMNTLHRVESERSWPKRMALSLALAAAVGACLLGAIAVAGLGPLLYGSYGALAGVGLFLVRWALAGALLLLAVGLLVNYGPDRPQPLRWVSFGSLVVIVAWLVMSSGFGFYLRAVASFGSVFSNLATVVVLMAYIYLSALVFLGGLQLDALVREEVDGSTVERS
ncbi:MAG: YihY/virulence factor BrkB family protein [Actinomycetota bacterium]|nr:YihY/virulence factor BrkB family protein [Actinomycetota bacterium]